MNYSRRLPKLPSELLGRQDALDDVVSLLTGKETIVTLTGPGGIGKTSLAIAVGNACKAHFTDGVFYIELASIEEIEDVLPVIHSALGLDEKSGDLLESIIAFFDGKNALLILDNLEQIIEAAGEIAQICRALPDLRVLTTSREALRIRGEYEYPLSMLKFPAAASTFLLNAIAEYPALHLFITRIQERVPTFQLTEQSLDTAIQICEKLDGLPLALELAAARAKTISLTTLLEQLDRGIQVLSHGPRDLPERHQALLNTIRWSYDLLPEEEQAFFRKLAIFADTWSVDAAALIQSKHGKEITYDEALILVSSLTEKNLVKKVEEGVDRYTLLVTIRQFAKEECITKGEWETLQEHHAEYFIDYLARAREHFHSAQATEWLNKLDLDHENHSATMHYLIEKHDDRAVKMVAQSWWYWKAKAHLVEGGKWINQILSTFPALTDEQHYRLRIAAASLANFQGRFDDSEGYGKEALELARKLNDPFLIQSALNNYGMLLGIMMSRYTEAEALLEEAIKIGRTLEPQDNNVQTLCIINLASVLANQKKFEKATSMYLEALEFFRKAGDINSTCLVLANLGICAYEKGDYTESIRYLEESVTLQRSLGDKSEMAQLLHNLGMAYGKAGRLVNAIEIYREGLIRATQLDNLPLVALQLLDAADDLKEKFPALAQKLMRYCAVLVENNKEDKNFHRTFTQHGGKYPEVKRLLLNDLTPFFETTNEEIVQLMDEALLQVRSGSDIVSGATTLPTIGMGAPSSQVDTEAVQPKEPSGILNELSEREQEVLKLIAQGMKDAEIAETLFISVRTVNAHLRSIYSKLNIKTRSQATRIAVEEGLA